MQAEAVCINHTLKITSKLLQFLTKISVNTGIFTSVRVNIKTVVDFFNAELDGGPSKLVLFTFCVLVLVTIMMCSPLCNSVHKTVALPIIHQRLFHQHPFLFSIMP
jgi:hypothetical protein